MSLKLLSDVERRLIRFKNRHKYTLFNKIKYPEICFNKFSNVDIALDKFIDLSKVYMNAYTKF